MKLLILLLLSTQLNAAELYFGLGQNIKIPGKDDTNKPVVLSVSYDSDYFVTLNYRDKYRVYNTDIDKHFILAAGKRLIDYNGFFLDFGLSTSSELSIANSSRVMFYERFGYSYSNFRLSISHTSNGGLVPPNEGETAIMFEYKF